jgi:hypothetical protein
MRSIWSDRPVLTIFKVLTTMYLKDLFRHNKAWFTVTLLFILCQLFINFKRGMVVSPFYHYGMYSEVMKPKENYPVFEITADGELLKTQDFSVQQWDKIMQPVIYYSRHKEWNADMFSEVRRITGLNDTAKYVSNVQKKDFFDWYTRYLSHILGKEVRSLTVQQKNYLPGR